jgi:hypothetical protein
MQKVALSGLRTLDENTNGELNSKEMILVGYGV